RLIVLSLTTLFLLFFFFSATAPPYIYTLSLHDALPIFLKITATGTGWIPASISGLRNISTPMRDIRLPRSSSGQESCHLPSFTRSEEHTSELQSRFDLVCRLLLEKKKKKQYNQQPH